MNARQLGSGSLLVALVALVVYGLYSMTYGGFTYQTGKKIEPTTTEINTSTTDGHQARLAVLHFDDERYLEAAQAAASAIEFDGANPELLVLLGRSIVGVNDGFVTEDAEIAFLETLKLEPESVWARYYLAKRKSQQGNLPKAVKEWLALLREQDLSDEFRRLVDNSVRVGLENLAVQRGEAPPDLPDTDILTEASGRLDNRMAEDNDVIREWVRQLERSLDKTPNDLQSWRQLAVFHVRLEDPAAARRVLRKASGHFLADPDALREIAELFEVLGLSDMPEPADIKGDD